MTVRALQAGADGAFAATAPGTGPSPRSELRRGLARQIVLLVLLAAAAAPAATPAAAWVRWAFPAFAALVAGELARRGRAATYLTFCLWLLILTPFVRRVVDAQVGFAQANALMLAPYLAAAWAGLQAPRFFAPSGRPGQWPMLMVFAAVFYGFLLAIARGRFFPGTLDLLRWSVPPLLTCWVVVQRRHWQAICLEVRAWALLALPLLSLYGLYQFVAPPRWDVLWMLNGGMNSIGRPQPFEIRVFGSMNSPASLAYYLEALILLTLAQRSKLRWLNAILGLAALALTLVRSAWLGLAVGLLLLLVRAPLRVRGAAVMVVLGALALSPLALIDPRVERLVSQRVETVGNLEGDKSFSDRKRDYSASFGEITQTPWGQGLGIANVAANYTSERRAVDGGPIEIFLSLGLIGGSIYLGSIGLLLAAAILRRWPAEERALYAAALAILVAQAMALVSLTSTVGEIGVLFWITLGLMLASPKSTAKPAFRSLDGRNERRAFRPPATGDAPPWPVARR
jgi:O-antigen ligase